MAKRGKQKNTAAMYLLLKIETDLRMVPIKQTKHINKHSASSTYYMS